MPQIPGWARQSLFPTLMGQEGPHLWAKPGETELSRRGSEHENQLELKGSEQKGIAR